MDAEREFELKCEMRAEQSRQATRFYICPNQFENETCLDSADVDTFIDDETVARVAAKALTSYCGHAVTIQVSFNTYGDHWEDDDSIVVSIEEKVA